jgi:hypothetical protein
MTAAEAARRHLHIGARELVLGMDELLEVDVIGQGHAARVNLEDVALRLDVGQRELDLAVDTTGTKQRGIQGLDAIRCHDDLRRAA